MSDAGTPDFVCLDLLQKQYKLITPCASVLDLGCSDGAWLQDQNNLCGCGEFDERSSVSSGSEEAMDEKWKLSRKGHSSRNGRIGEDGKRSTLESLSRRGANLVKEQRAKFYIMRRCVAMLICWRD